MNLIVHVFRPVFTVHKNDFDKLLLFYWLVGWLIYLFSEMDLVCLRIPLHLIINHTEEFFGSLLILVCATIMEDYNYSLNVFSSIGYKF